MSKRYTIKPSRNKITFTKESWTKNFEKEVRVNITIMWRSSIFHLTLTEDEKNKIERLNEIEISDYDYEIHDIYDPCELFVEIENEEEYTDEQLKEIKSTIYDEDDTYRESTMEMNGWTDEDTIYSIKGEFTIED
tara:strand:- start:653 stop:1057 length:405 start_codon:yes stop_codon:yes gene_type:complete